MATNASILALRISKEWTWSPGLATPREWRIGWNNCPGSVKVVECRLRRRVPLAINNTGGRFRGEISMDASNGSIEHKINADERILQKDSDAVRLNDETQCHVEIVSWRERRIKASVLVGATEEKVWEVLTDYERLAEFIPNLVCSERIPCPYPGRIWLLQRGMQRTMYWNIEARVVLDLEELPHMENGSELRFSMVDGDFKRYEGKWYLRPGPRPQTTVLHYEVNVVPRLFFPAAFVERIIKADLPVNLCALANRAKTDYESQSKTSIIPETVPSMTSDGLSLRNLEVAAPSRITVDSFSTVASINELTETAMQFQHLTDAHGAGIHAIPIKSKEITGGTDSGDVDHHWNGIGKACQLGHQRVADEIHFRRLDDLLENGGVHRRVVATITVKAPPKDVWAVLTAYESLPEFVPNLANSMVLFRENSRVRLLQEGCKCLLYMVLHARVVLDLWERPEYEIAFKQVEGDFDSFQGKWTLKQFGSQHTLLKYVVDTKIRKDCLLAESIVEEVIYEDLPSNLCAIRDRVESSAKSSSSLVNLSEAIPKSSLIEFTEPATPTMSHASLQIDQLPSVSLEEKESSVGSTVEHKYQMKSLPKAHTKSPRVVGLKSDYRVLEKEIRNFIVTHGQEGIMPMRNFLRLHGRVDLEKAITSMGGFGTIATRMKLSLAYEQRKAKGYWDKLQNLKNEVIAFQKESGIEQAVMPSRKSMEISGRYDLARALEKWGGVKEVARILGLETLKGRGYARKQPARLLLACNENETGIHKSLEGITSSNVTEEIPQHPSKKGIATSSHGTGELPQHPSKKGITTSSNGTDVVPQHPPKKGTSSNGTEEIPQHPSKKLLMYSVNHGKHKKMPYKTDVPQESSKWLTLLTEAQSNLTSE